MKLYFYGADKEVTGSCHCLELGGKRILFDCGLQQGGDTKDNGALPFAAGVQERVRRPIRWTAVSRMAPEVLRRMASTV